MAENAPQAPASDKLERASLPAGLAGFAIAAVINATDHCVLIGPPALKLGMLAELSRQLVTLLLWPTILLTAASQPLPLFNTYLLAVCALNGMFYWLACRLLARLVPTRSRGTNE